MRAFLHRLWTRARELGSGPRLRREFDQELAFHLEAEVEHNLARGMPPEQARRAALVAFGGVSRFREETHGARGFAALDALGRDLRLAIRRLGRAPAFTAGVIATLAIALGAAAGIGALVHGVAGKPLPYPDPDRLVRIAVHTPGLGITTEDHSAGTFQLVREDAASLAAVGAYGLNEGVTITEGEPERVVGAFVTPSLFPLLGMAPAAGRLFVAEDAEAATPGVLLGHGLWQRRFGGDSGVVGGTIELGRRPRRILGVLPASTEAPWDRVAVYFPEEVATGSAGLNSRYLTVVGRLAQGATLASAQQDLDRVTTRLPERYPDVTASALREAGFRLTARPLHAATLAPVRGELRLLALMMVVLLLIATANVITLALLRAERLRGEIAVASALGAPHTAVLRRFLLEGSLLGAAGGLLALPVAALAIGTRFGFTLGEIPRLQYVSLSAGLVGALGAVALGIGGILGVVSAARAHDGGRGALRGEARATGGRRWRRAQRGLVTLQVALALALLLGAGLMGASLFRLQHVDVGFAPEGRSIFSLRALGSAYTTWAQVTGFHLQIEERLRNTPGITEAGVAMQFPSTPHLLYMQPRLDAPRSDGRTAQAFVTINVVSPAFHQAMGIPLQAGRPFDPGDLGSASPGVMLSAALARELFGSEDPIGRSVTLASGGRFPPYRVIGVCGDVFGDRVADGPLRILYLPLVAALPEGVEMPVVPAGVTFVVRSDLPLDDLAPTFRAVVASVDPRLPVWGIRTLEALVADTMARTRLTMLLLGVAALATLLLSAVGLYSVIAYAAAARAGEFAVRLALGASPGSVMRLVLREGAGLALVGIALGIGLSLAGARVLRNLLYEVSPTDPVLYLAGAATILLTAVVATLVPARHASRAAPASVLRSA